MMIVVAALLLGGTAVAQQGARRGMNADLMTESMVKEYSLNEEQKAKLLEVNKAFVQKMQSLRPQRTEGEQGGRPRWTEQQRTQMQEARQAYEAQIKSILTEEQYKAYQKAQQERFNRAPRGGQGRR